MPCRFRRHDALFDILRHCHYAVAACFCHAATALQRYYYMPCHYAAYCYATFLFALSLMALPCLRWPYALRALLRARCYVERHVACRFFCVRHAAASFCARAAVYACHAAPALRLICLR